MRRTLPAVALTVALVLSLLTPSAAGDPQPEPLRPAQPEQEMLSLENVGPFGDITFPVNDSPLGRAEAWMPQDPGTKKWITLDYGPYVVHPGSDLGRIDIEVPGQNGYAVGFEPLVIDAGTGDEVSNHHMHIHHAHWTWLDPDAPGNHRWFYGTGEERTQGSLMPSVRKDPRFKSKGLRYGIKVEAGDRFGLISMLHNKMAEARTVFIRVRIQFVYGTHDEIMEAKGWDFHNLKPVLVGSTFNVPRAKGDFIFPLDATKKTIGPHGNYSNPVANSKVVPGVGQIWTVPWDGTVVIGAGHSHPGAKEIVLSNMGTKRDPCPDDGDEFPGVTAARSTNYTYKGVWGSSAYQQGVTQAGWRMHVRKGDRLVLNGVYEPKGQYEYLDAMSYFGMYIDTRDKPKSSQYCKVELIDKPGAPKSEITRTVLNRKWEDQDNAPVCKRCDKPGPNPEPGLETNTIHIAGHTYLPGNLGSEGEPMGPPVISQGDTLRVINEDYAEAGVRHSVTSCKAPCNGPYAANYPFHDGSFHSGALGYTWEETYVTARQEPYWEFDTSKLEKGYHTYFCQLHPWMRGGFYIE
ncbi:MAG: cupredoxin domain-containing protein [Actinomycetota bacterium]